MVGAGFGMGRINAVRGAWYVLRAQPALGAVPDNDPAGARQVASYAALRAAV